MMPYIIFSFIFFTIFKTISNQNTRSICINAKLSNSIYSGGKLYRDRADRILSLKAFRNYPTFAIWSRIKAENLNAGIDKGYLFALEQLVEVFTRRDVNKLSIGFKDYDYNIENMMDLDATDKDLIVILAMDIYVDRSGGNYTLAVGEIKENENLVDFQSITSNIRIDQFTTWNSGLNGYIPLNIFGNNLRLTDPPEHGAFKGKVEEIVAYPMRVNFPQKFTINMKKISWKDDKPLDSLDFYLYSVLSQTEFTYYCPSLEDL